jgi:hypothetical protein
MGKKKQRGLRNLSMVRITADCIKTYQLGKYRKFKRYESLLGKNGKKQNCFLYLGEVPNATGHCAVVDTDGRVHWLYHMDEFEEIED